MRLISTGTETEYGLLVEGFGAREQVEQATAFVRSYPGERFFGWDNRFESPRADLRGFSVDRLAQDPVDAAFDAGKAYRPVEEIRADQVLPDGSRFYNDHGHPEFSTAESFSIFENALTDHQGHNVLLDAARRYSEVAGREVRVFKNNTDFHGASYGTHESYLVPRVYGFDKLFPAVLPMLVARQILTGAGKVGSEAGEKCNFQISQRADFFVEPANLETLYRRPIFNTRDEPHSLETDWIRMHVISCDANQNPRSTALRLGLVKLALHLLDADMAPVWRIKDPVRAFSKISKDAEYRFEVELEGKSWTTAFEIIESYLAAGESCLVLDAEMKWVISESRLLLGALKDDHSLFRRSVDWASKKFILEQVIDDTGCRWDDPSLAAYDLEYSDINPEVSLFHALLDAGEINADLPTFESPPLSRAFARGLAVQNFQPFLKSAAWRGLTFRLDGKDLFVDLPPNAQYPKALADAPNVEAFIEILRGVK